MGRVSPISFIKRIVKKDDTSQKKTKQNKNGDNQEEIELRVKDEKGFQSESNG